MQTNNHSAHALPLNICRLTYEQRKTLHGLVEVINNFSSYGMSDNETPVRENEMKETLLGFIQAYLDFLLHCENDANEIYQLLRYRTIDTATAELIAKTLTGEIPDCHDNE